MSKYQLHHIHVATSDQKKTAEFCEKLFRAKKLWKRNLSKNPHHTYDIDLNGTQIDLVASGPELPTHDPGFRGALEHICLRTDDIQAAAEELRANGARAVREILPGSNSLEPAHKVVYFLIPGDVTIELNDTK